MTEKEIKELCKWAVENSQKELTVQEKECLKIGIDHAGSIEDLFLLAFTMALKH